MGMSQIFELKLSRGFSVKKLAGTSQPGFALSHVEPNYFEPSQFFFKIYVKKLLFSAIHFTFVCCLLLAIPYGKKSHITIYV